MKKYFILLISMTMCLCYSCQNNKDIAKINFTIDSCTVSHPDIKQITSKVNIAMIDIKKWNDTTFLFLIPSNMNSTISLYTYYWDNGFNLLSKYELSDSISNFFLKNQYNSITFINKDSLIAGGNNNFAIIDLKKNEISPSYQPNENEYLQATQNPLQWNSKHKLLLSEYLNYSNPTSELGIVQTEIIACIDIYNNKLYKIPIKMINEEQIKLDPNYVFHFSTFDDKIIGKHSIKNEFIVYNFNDNSVKTIENDALANFNKKFTNKEKERLEKLQKQLGLYDFRLNEFANNYIQKAIVCDQTNGNIIVAYLDPVPQDGKDGKKPPISYRAKTFLIFDKDFNLLGEIKTDVDNFTPSMFFSIDNNIFLVEICFNKLNIKRISYES
jgi:hypothetical protein